MTEDITPKKRGRPVGAVDTAPRKLRSDKVQVSEGDNEKITMHNLHLMTLPAIDVDNRECVERRIEEYFKICIEDDARPGVAGLCLALGISRQAWQTWGAGTRRHGDYVDIVEKARRAMEAILEQYMLHGKINPVTGIFLLKNNFGYKDQSDVVITPNIDPLGEQKDSEQLRQKYLEAAYNTVDDSEYTKKVDAMRKKYVVEGQDDGAPD